MNAPVRAIHRIAETLAIFIAISLVLLSAFLAGIYVGVSS